MSEPGNNSLIPSATIRYILLAAPAPVERSRSGRQADPEADPASFLHRWYIGELEQWQCFQQDVYQFFTSAEMQNVLATRATVLLEHRKDSHSEASFKVEPAKLPTELDFCTSFLQQVFIPCEAIARSIVKPEEGT
jgi:hypothetical protein